MATGSKDGGERWHLMKQLYDWLWFKEGFFFFPLRRLHFLTLAKNLISCSWGDFSTLPLLTTASGWTQAHTNINRYHTELYIFSNRVLSRTNPDVQWTLERSPSTSGASGGSRKQSVSRWRRSPAPCPSSPWTKDVQRDWRTNQKVPRFRKIGHDCVFRTVPSDSISFKLEEFKQVLGFFPVTGFLLGRQSVVRNKQRMGTTT